MRILVIEDEQHLAQAIKKGLEQEHYVVDLAFDGEVAFDLASEINYDLILTDIMLPNLDGLALTRKLRATHIQIPILVITARGQIKDKVHGLDAGADDYLSKPFAFEELLARIRALARRPKQIISHELKAGDLVLDTASYAVTIKAKSIHLSSKEFALLEYLMRHQNTVVTKPQIIQNLWDYDKDVLPNTIEVYIRHLRKKLDAPIETIRGFGYRLKT